MAGSRADASVAASSILKKGRQGGTQRWGAGRQEWGGTWDRDGFSSQVRLRAYMRLPWASCLLVQFQTKL